MSTGRIVALNFFRLSRGQNPRYSPASPVVLATGSLALVLAFGSLLNAGLVTLP